MIFFFCRIYMHTCMCVYLLTYMTMNLFLNSGEKKKQSKFSLFAFVNPSISCRFKFFFFQLLVCVVGYSGGGRKYYVMCRLQTSFFPIDYLFYSCPAASYPIILIPLWLLIMKRMRGMQMSFFDKLECFQLFFSLFLLTIFFYK